MTPRGRSESTGAQSLISSLRQSLGRQSLGGWTIAAGSLLDHLDTVLSLLGEQPSGLFLDLDGTLAEIVPRPEQTSVRPAVSRTLRALQRRLALVAVVTGRPALQARDILGVDELVYAGNHGLELLREGRLEVAEEARGHLETVSRLLELVRAAFPEEGLVFEGKAGSFAVHHRLAADPEGVRRRLLRFMDEEAGEDVKLIMGKEVVNVLAPVDLDKGTALTHLSRRYHLAAAVVMGDDVTDLDAFRASRALEEAGEMRGLRVAVVDEESPPEVQAAADYTLSGVPQVEWLLSWLEERTR